MNSLIKSKGREDLSAKKGIEQLMPIRGTGGPWRVQIDHSLRTMRKAL